MTARSMPSISIRYSFKVTGILAALSSVKKRRNIWAGLERSFKRESPPPRSLSKTLGPEAPYEGWVRRPGAAAIFSISRLCGLTSNIAICNYPVAMPRLRNPRHEAFAQALFAGETQRRAYVLAGYKDGNAHGGRLAGHGDVVGRVEELRRAREW